MRIFSPAKINLHLRVGPLAADGFHPILSWMATVGLGDELDVQSSADAGVRLRCDRADLAVDRTNLIVRAAETLAKEAERTDFGADIVLKKRIPIGGGLGGGSSNAAFALIALNEVWKLNWPKHRLAALGAKLGSDVPFFFYAPSGVCSGRGENVVPISLPMAKHVLLIFPKFGVSTAQAYKTFDQMNLASATSVTTSPPWETWTKLKAVDLLENLVNDLEAPAFSISPELAELRRMIESRIGRIIRMSGSGSTLFTLFDSAAEAENARKSIAGIEVDAMATELR